MSTASKPKGKAAKLARTAGKVADESMGATRRNGTPGPAPDRKLPDHIEGTEYLKNGRKIAVGRIKPDPGQPRKEFDEAKLEELKESLLALGQQQPIKAFYNKEGKFYQIIAGERRWRAANLAGLKTLDCIVAEEPDDVARLLEQQMAENLGRSDLTPMEQARAFQRLKKEFGRSQSDIARSVGVSASEVSRLLALLKLPDEIQDLVGQKGEEGRISPSSAYELTKVHDPDIQRELAGSAAEGLMAHEELVHQVREANAGTRHSGPERVPALPPVDPGPTPIPEKRVGDPGRNGKHAPEPPESDGWKGMAPPQLANPEPSPDPVDSVDFELVVDQGGETWLNFRVVKGPLAGVKMVLSLPTRFLDPRSALVLLAKVADRHICQQARLMCEPGARARIIDPGHEDHGKTGTVNPRSPVDPANVALWLDEQTGSRCYFEGVEVIGGDE